MSIITDLKAINNNNNSNVLIEKLKMDSKKDLENKNLERNKILFNGAIEQYLYENKENFPNSDNVAIEDKIRRFNNFISRTNNKSCSDKKKKSDNQFFDI